MRGGENLESKLNNHLQDYSQLVDLRHCNPFVKWAGGKAQIMVLIVTADGISLTCFKNWGISQGV
jgi:hypothetical protein